MTNHPLIACADIGSVARGNFGWWSSDGRSDNTPASLAEHVAAALNSGLPVALGFECPLFVPLSDDVRLLTSARPGEGSRPWSAGAGCGALATGLVQVVWLLRAVRARLAAPHSAHLEWESFCKDAPGLFLWEAFVSGEGKSTSHIEDARAAAEAFALSLPNPDAFNAVRCLTPVHSLIGAALLRTGWTNSTEVLAQACIVIRPGTNGA